MSHKLTKEKWTRDGGTKWRRLEKWRGRGDEGTRGRRDKRTKKRRNEETKGQRDEGSLERRNEAPFLLTNNLAFSKNTLFSGYTSLSNPLKNLRIAFLPFPSWSASSWSGFSWLKQLSNLSSMPSLSLKERVYWELVYIGRDNFSLNR